MTETVNISPCPVHIHDWTSLLPDDDHTHFLRTRNWSDTLLGPLNTWSSELRLYTIQAFTDNRPVCIYWGPSRVAVYNAPFKLLAGGTHPALMGSRFEDIYPEIVEQIFPLLAQGEATKKASVVFEMSLIVERNNFVEETFFDGNFVPLVLLDGTVGGFYNNVQEITTQKLNERRTKMFNLIAATTEPLTSTTVYAHITECLASNALDVPFALLWKVDFESKDGNHKLLQTSRLGLSESAELKCKHVHLHDDIGFMPLLYSAQRQITTIKFDPKLGGINWEDVTWGGHGKQSQTLAIVPLLSGDRLYGFLLVGNNPLRPLDDNYQQFLADLQNFTTSAVVATISADEAARRNEQLQEQLVESERQIRYMAQHSDIGMMQLAPDGNLIWANEHYHLIANGEIGNKPRQTFLTEAELLEGDIVHAKNVWSRVLQGEKVQTIELRLQRRYRPPNGDSVPSTIVLSAFAYKEKGKVKSVMAVLTQVSHLKWAELWQVQVAKDAERAKKRQREFIDAISHEVRNPLSAILQLADSIADSTTDLDNPTTQDCLTILRDNVDAAAMILKCARYQKKIVDDVLTLSRMDYTTLPLSAVDASMEIIIDEAIQLVEADAIASSVSLRTVQDSSMQTCAVSQVMCDSLRMIQVLVNLISNAIKFTRERPTRTITITYGATVSEPQEAFSSQVVWATVQESPEDPTLGADWGNGEPIWLTFTVQDTGSGMTSEDLRRVFNRFEQGSIKTTTKYSGSGLGLFISHTLTKRLGGGIGVTSEPGSGSTFAFYVRARRVTVTKEEPLNNTQTAKNGKRSRRDEAIPTATARSSKHSASKNITQKWPFHILMVEDNIINQMVLRKQLEKAGCTVHIANHGVEALEFIRKSSWWVENNGSGPRIEIILMDWEMPVMDGLSCTREIRSLEAAGKFTMHPEILAVTANVGPEQVQMAHSAGMDAMVPKPFVVSNLLEMIAKRLAV